MSTITIPQPDDWHVHLRDDEMLAAVVGYTAQVFRYAMVMPNLTPPITSTADAAAYKQRILSAATGDENDFRPIIPLYCSQEIEVADLRAGMADQELTAIKYYPAGATTNSDAGGTRLADYIDLFEILADGNGRLLVHAESTDPSIDIFDREQAFLERELAPLCQTLPELAVTVEHVSTRAGIEFVDAHDQVAATITPHHLSRERSDLLASGMHADLYCKPVINSAADREALVEAATRGPSAFLLGTDSAPHPTTSKYVPSSKPGIFNAAYGLEVVADIFEQAGRLDRLADFVSTNGCLAYGVEKPTKKFELSSKQQPPSDEPAPQSRLSTSSGDEVVMFGSNEAARWDIRVAN